MDTAKQHWEILRRVPEELANKVRAFMVIGWDGDGVLLATEDGKGYWLGEMRFGLFGRNSKQALEPTPLDVPNLVNMAQGNGHILLLDESGQIYSMGQNDCGQLGLGSDDEITRFTPQLIPCLHKFTSVQCGRWHSLALTKDGKVCEWGWYDFDYILSRSFVSFPSPHQIAELDPHRIVAVECGGAHSLALTDQGEVYAWGLNDDGQLGDGSKTSTHTPTLISTPIGRCKSMAAGARQTLLLTLTGEVYTCGWNGCGQLGVPTSTISSFSLVKVSGLPPISQVVAHFETHLSIAMSVERECFAWGQLNNYLGHTPFTFIPLRFPPIYSTIDSVLSFQSFLRNTPCSVRVEGLGSGPRRTNLEAKTESLTGIIRLGDRIAQMYDNPDSNPDVKFQLGNRAIMAHRSVLQISSVHFAHFFSGSFSPGDLNPQTSSILQSSSDSLQPQTPLTTIPILDHSYPTFDAYLRFLYTGILQVLAEHLTDLFELARSHFESDLEQLCLSRMRSTLSPENCCLFYQLTEPLPLPEFQQELIKFIAVNFFQVTSSDAYRSLNGEHLKKLTVSIDNLIRSKKRN